VIVKLYPPFLGRLIPPGEVAPCGKPPLGVLKWGGNPNLICPELETPQRVILKPVVNTSVPKGSLNPSPV